MADSNTAPRPDVAPGSLIFLEEADHDRRLILACCAVHDFLEDETEVAEIYCEDHFPDLVRHLVSLVGQCLGVVDFAMTPDDLGHIYAAMTEGLEQVDED